MGREETFADADSGLVAVTRWRELGLVLVSFIVMSTGCAGDGEAGPAAPSITAAASLTTLSTDDVTSGSSNDPGGRLEEVVGDDLDIDPASSAEQEKASSPTSTSSSTTSSPTTAAGVCDRATIARDMGAASTLVRDGCQAGWAVIDVCDDEPCGDSWVLARFEGGRWASVTGFPTPMCRSELEAIGAPGAVLDIVNWPPNCGVATTTAPATVDPYALLEVFIAAWNSGEWDKMATVAEPSVVQLAQASVVVDGTVLPGPPRGRCFFGFPKTTCEVAYGTSEAGALYVLTVAERIEAMERSS